MIVSSPSLLKFKELSVAKVSASVPKIEHGSLITNVFSCEWQHFFVDLQYIPV